MEKQSLDELVSSLSKHLNLSKYDLLQMSVVDLLKIFKEKHKDVTELRHLRNYEEAEYLEMIADEVGLFILERFELIKK